MVFQVIDADLLLGVVTGKADKKQYHGDQYFPAGSYDYVFDVELGSADRSVFDVELLESI